MFFATLSAISEMWGFQHRFSSVRLLKLLRHYQSAQLCSHGAHLCWPHPFVFSACSDVLSMATALDDFIAPDCRFINIKKGQMVYVYSKLVPEEGAGVFWSGSVCAYFSMLQLEKAELRQTTWTFCPFWERSHFDTLLNIHFYCIENVHTSKWLPV